MVWAQLIATAQKALPLLAKALPKLWPLLLDERTRKKVLGLLAEVPRTNATKRLRARTELTRVLAEGFGAQAESVEDKAAAEEWVRRAQNLLRRLDMPVVGRRAKAEHRKSVRAQLETLHSEINEYLGD